MATFITRHQGIYSDKCPKNAFNVHTIYVCTLLNYYIISPDSPLLSPTTRHWLKSYTLLAPSDWPPLSIVNLSNDLHEYNETLSAILIEFITRSLLSCSEIEKHSATMVWFKQRSEEDCPTASEWLTGPSCFAGRQTQGTPRITRHTTIIISWLYRLYNVRWLEATKVTFLNIFSKLFFYPHFRNSTILLYIKI